MMLFMHQRSFDCRCQNANLICVQLFFVAYCFNPMLSECFLRYYSDQGASGAPSIFGTGRINLLCCVHWKVCRPNWTSTTYQLMTLAEAEIKIAAINRKQVNEVPASMQKTNGNPKTNPAFSWSGLKCGNCAMSVWVVNQRWLPKSKVEMKQRNISAYMQDINEINSKGYISTFLGSSNTSGLVWTLTDIGMSDKSKMAAIIGSTNKITHYISFYKSFQQNSKGYTHICNTARRVRTLSDIEVRGTSEMAAIANIS